MEDRLHEDHDKVLNVLSVKKIWVPIFFSLLFLGYLIWKDQNFSLQNLALIKEMKIWGALGALTFLGLRDGLYMLRIYMLTEKAVSFKDCFIIVVLWEFSSAVTPSAIGGAFVAVFLFMNIGVSLGKSLAYVMSSAILDNLFFIAFGPLGFIHSFQDPNFAQVHAYISYPFWVSYILIALYTEFMGGGLFLMPNLFKWLMIKMTSWGFLKRYQEAAIKQGNDIILASKSFGRKDVVFWLKIILLTFVIWISRYLILNSLATSFIDCSAADHFKIFCNHLVMWVTMLISPTPGSSGTAEYVFYSMYGGLFGKYTMVIALVWRIFTYYVYLLAGVLILPKWIKQVNK